MAVPSYLGYGRDVRWNYTSLPSPKSQAHPVRREEGLAGETYTSFELRMRVKLQFLTVSNSPNAFALSRQ